MSARAALDRIPEVYRLPIWFRFCMGFGSAETAETLAIPEQHLSKLIAVGMQKLGQALKATNPLHDPSNLERALANSPVESAPSSLLDRIGAITAQATTPRPKPKRVTRSSRGRFPVTLSAQLAFDFRDGLTLGEFDRIHYN